MRAEDPCESASPAPVPTAPGVAHFTVLLLDEDARNAGRVREMLFEVGASRFHITHVDRVGHAAALLARVPFDAVLFVPSKPLREGLEALTPVRLAAGEVPIVVLTSGEDDEAATQALRLGAQDCQDGGPSNAVAAGRAIRHAVERKRFERALRETAGDPDH